MNHMKSTYLIICGWSSFPLNPAWGKLKTTLSNRLILRSVWSFIVFAFTPCKITAPNFLRSAKLDSAPLYFFFRVSAKDHLENNGNQIKDWSQKIAKMLLIWSTRYKFPHYWRLCVRQNIRDAIQAISVSQNKTSAVKT